MADYFCRVCYNSNDWVSPTGDAGETPAYHYGNFNFGYEEWNFNFSASAIHKDGYKYGWIEGFTGVPNGLHNVALYVYEKGVDGVNGRFVYVGKINYCEKISPHVSGVFTPIMANQANHRAHTNITVVGSDWHVHPVVHKPNMPAHTIQPMPNMRFRKEDFCYHYPEKHVLDVGYSHYTALNIDSTTSTIDRRRIWDKLPC